jgi:hypothetical protein
MKRLFCYFAPQKYESSTTFNSGLNPPLGKLNPVVLNGKQR